MKRKLLLTGILAMLLFLLICIHTASAEGITVHLNVSCDTVSSSS